MKTEVWVSFNYGGWNIAFSKIMELGFTPFYDLVLFDTDGNHELSVELKNTNYVTTQIMHQTNSKDLVVTGSFFIEVRNVWPSAVRPEIIDEEIENFTRFGWTREDTTDIAALKNLMLREGKRREF